MIKVVHVVNQFFAGLGGEEKAGLPVGVIAGSAGAARALSQKLGADAQIACTIYVGDNYFHEHKDEAMTSNSRCRSYGRAGGAGRGAGF